MTRDQADAAIWLRIASEARVMDLHPADDGRSPEEIGQLLNARDRAVALLYTYVENPSLARARRPPASGPRFTLRCDHGNYRRACAACAVTVWRID